MALIESGKRDPVLGSGSDMKDMIKMVRGWVGAEGWAARDVPVWALCLLREGWQEMKPWDRALLSSRKHG